MRTQTLPLPLLPIAASSAGAQSVCRTPTRPGREQSPVDIRTATATSLNPLVTSYPVSRGRLLNTGNNVQVNVAPGGSITVDSTRFDLQEFHFHWPAVAMRPTFEIGDHSLDGVDCLGREDWLTVLH